MKNVISTWLNDWDNSFEDNSSNNVSHSNHHLVTEQENGWPSDRDSLSLNNNQLFFEKDGTKWSTFLIIHVSKWYLRTYFCQYIDCQYANI